MSATTIQRAVAIGIGATAGVTAGAVIRSAYPDDSNSEVLSSSDVVAKVAPIALTLAGAIGAGCMRAQNSTPGGLSTALLAAAALSAGPSTAALSNSNGNSENALTAMGVVAAVSVAGFAAGRFTHGKSPIAAKVGVGSLSLAAGMVIPWSIKNYISSFSPQ